MLTVHDLHNEAAAILRVSSNHMEHRDNSSYEGSKGVRESLDYVLMAIQVIGATGNLLSLSWSSKPPSSLSFEFPYTTLMVITGSSSETNSTTASHVITLVRYIACWLYGHGLNYKPIQPSNEPFGSANIAAVECAQMTTCLRTNH